MGAGEGGADPGFGGGRVSPDGLERSSRYYKSLTLQDGRSLERPGVPARSALQPPGEGTGPALGKGVGGGHVGAMVGTREWHFLSPTVGASAVTDLPRAFPPAPGGMVVGKGGKQPCVPWKGGRRVPASNHARNCPPKAKTLVSPCPATAQPMRGRSAQPMRSRPLGVLQWAPVQGSPPRLPSLYKSRLRPLYSQPCWRVERRCGSRLWRPSRGNSTGR